MHGIPEKDLLLNSPIVEKSAETLIQSEFPMKIGDHTDSLVKAIPFTGITHQIRIHLSEAGYKIVGDPIYGNAEESFFKNKSLFLFAGGIQFLHPTLNKELSFEIPLPKRFRNLFQYTLR